MGSQDADKARLRVIDELLTAVKIACDACVRQEKEDRDRCILTIENTKVGDRYMVIYILNDGQTDLPTDGGTGSTRLFFFGVNRPDGLFVRFVCVCFLLFQ